MRDFEKSKKKIIWKRETDWEAGQQYREWRLKIESYPPFRISLEFGRRIVEWKEFQFIFLSSFE